jgi:hypothetical protein
MAKAKKTTTPKSAKTTKKQPAAPVATEVPNDVMDSLMAIPTQGAQEFIAIWEEDNQIEVEQAALNARKRNKNARLKTLKILVPVYSHVRKLSKMEKHDRQAWYAATSMLKVQLDTNLQLDLGLTGAEKEAMDQLVAKREAARDAMLAAGGGDSGKEVGSAAAQVMAGAIGGDGLAAVTVGHPANSNIESIPARNDELSSEALDEAQAEDDEQEPNQARG